MLDDFYNAKFPEDRKKESICNGRFNLVANFPVLFIRCRNKTKLCMPLNESLDWVLVVSVAGESLATHLCPYLDRDIGLQRSDMGVLEKLLTHFIEDFTYINNVHTFMDDACMTSFGTMLVVCFYHCAGFSELIWICAATRGCGGPDI